MPLIQNTLTALAVAIMGMLLVWRIIILLPAYKKKHQNLVAYFRRIRIRSLRLQKQFSHFMLSNNLSRDDFTDGMTYGEYYKFLKKNHISNLSDKNYLRIKKSQNPFEQKKVLDMLKNQEITLNEAENKFSVASSGTT